MPYIGRARRRLTPGATPIQYAHSGELMAETIPTDAPPPHAATAGAATAAAAGAAAPAAGVEAAPLPVLAQFLRFWHDPKDEPYGLVYAVTEVFPAALVDELKALVPQLPAAIREGRSDAKRDQKVEGLDGLAYGDAAERACHALVGLLGCIRGGVLDLACDALVALGKDALPFIDAVKTFGYEVDMKDGRNTLALFGERAIWEKMVRKTGLLIDRRRGNLIDRLVAKLFT